MNVRRTAAIVIGAGALAAWLVAAATSGNRESVEPLILKSPVIDSRGAALASEIQRLHERLRPTATPPQSARDLFSFGRSARKPLAPVQVPQPMLSDAPPPRPAPPA